MNAEHWHDRARTDAVMQAIDAYVYSDKAKPLSGWHDDYRGKDRTGAYLPALQQVKAEFRGLVEAVIANGLGQKCVQLGLGSYGAAHVAFRQMFDIVCSVDMYSTPHTELEKRWATDPRADIFFVGDTHSQITQKAVADAIGLCDVLFIDAGHNLNDVRLDYRDYSPLVRKGGIVAFHDSLLRKGYEAEIEVWRFMAELKAQGVPLVDIGSEVGISLYVKGGHD